MSLPDRNTLVYAGIGSRQTPSATLNVNAGSSQYSECEASLLDFLIDSPLTVDTEA